MTTRRWSMPNLGAPVAIAWVTVVGTCLVLPFGAHLVGSTVSFMPALISMVTCFDILSVVLLLGGYRDVGDRRLLVMACAYAWSMVVMLGYALAFPGAVAQVPPLAATMSTAPYLYVIWHGGFPLILALATAPWPERFRAPTHAARRTRAAASTISLSVLGGLAVVAVIVSQSTRLPDLIVGLDTSRMTSLTAPLVVPLVLASLLASYLGTRGRSGPERWGTVVILVCACDLVLTYASRERFSLGWYCGRMLTVVAAGLVVVAMIASFRRLSARAEHNAAHDVLTGLANRRTADDSLDQMMALAQRTGRPLGAISLDLDHFKQVNDRHGHAVGDSVLRAVAEQILVTCRASDMVARVGGEEFLALLPDSDQEGTAVLAEKLRRAIASLEVPGLLHPLTASLGVTTLRIGDSPGELVRRADEALYKAKHAGRNQVVEAAGDDWQQLLLDSGIDLPVVTPLP